MSQLVLCAVQFFGPISVVIVNRLHYLGFRGIQDRRLSSDCYKVTVRALTVISSLNIQPLPFGVVSCFPLALQTSPHTE